MSYLLMVDLACECVLLHAGEAQERLVAVNDFLFETGVDNMRFFKLLVRRTSRACF